MQEPPLDAARLKVEEERQKAMGQELEYIRTTQHSLGSGIVCRNETAQIARDSIRSPLCFEKSSVVPANERVRH